MTPFARRLSFALMTTLGIGTVGFGMAPVDAATFNNRPIDSDDVVAIASPVGNSSHQLLILEQIGNQRDCWRETGNTIDPLLLDFDFTGICGRGTDSNGYSVRVGNQDLSWRYSLRIERRGGQLRLLASSNTDRSAPPLEVGTAEAIAGDYVRINLNPGWSITKRTYNGQVLGHYYLTHNQPLDSLIAAATPAQPESSSNLSAPDPPPIMSVQPSNPDSLPTIQIPSGSPSRTYEGTPPPPSNHASRLGLNYRVVVPIDSDSAANRVRLLSPDAFRISLDGELAMQAGVFRERSEAEALQRRLEIYGLDAGIVEVADSGGNPGIGSGGNLPTPITPPSRPSTSLPSVPNNRFRVVIDPGHGGRDPGAIGIGGLQERDVVNDISSQVSSILERQGVQVVMTRSTDRTLELSDRTAIANRSGADIFVSIHANAISLSRPEVNGAETYYYSSRAGYQLASSIHRSVLQRTGMGDRGVREARFYVLRNTSMPAALVETGFVTGSQDAARLRNSAFRTRMAEAIAAGILDYLQ